MRGKKAEKRIAQPDKRYNNRYVAKFINRIMHDGKKSIAEGVFYKAMDIIGSKNQNPLEVFERALLNVGPKVEVKPRRVGGASYQVPTEVRGERKMSLAIRWVASAARKRSSKEYHTFSEKLAAELLDAFNNQGEAIKKRDTVLRVAEANKAFAHFRW